ncbi:MAG: RNA methyltransferase [Chlamydiales bacterium]|nr:RNA methyltransferase [Chlamydiia bacterium]MCP5507995.1 RNA methyltransferase [Chlamydiales bacterium]
MKRELSSVQHSVVKHLVKLRQNHDYREDHGTLMIEGVKMVGELCRHHHIKRLLVLDESLIPDGLSAEETFIVPEQVINKISGTRTPEGIIAEIAIPKNGSLARLQHVVAFDGVSDPGNLGTLLRTALALGWEGVFLLDGTCDPYNDKALRAARGATFRLPWRRGTIQELKQLVADNKLRPFVADTAGVPLGEVHHEGGILLILANEGHGPSPEAAALAEKVTIPMPGEMESLNVSAAGAIMMYAFLNR